MTESRSTATATARKPRWRRWLIGLAIIVLVLMMLPLTGWWWAGRDGSLRQALQLAQWFLPDQQSLEFREVEGSIRGGGDIGHLQWSSPGTQLTIDGLRLEWKLAELFDHFLDVRTLRIDTVHVRLTPQPKSPDDAFQMPADASLPIRLTLPVTIGSLQIETTAQGGGSNTLAFDDVAGLYRFDGTQHLLRLDSAHYGDSEASAEATLDAHSLALDARLTSTLRNLTPGTPFAMQLTLQAAGNLGGGEAATVDVRIDGNEIASDDAGAQLHAEATLHPWAAQPAQQLDLQFERLNAHAFHSRAPATDLHGRATLQPLPDADSQTWTFALDLANDAPGAWDAQQLPLRSLTARGQLDRETLNVEAAQAELFGSAAAGRLTLTGAMPLRQPASSTGQLQVQDIDLKPLMSNLPRSRISGHVSIDPGQWRADVRNALAGPLDRERLPFDQLLADIQVTPELWRTENLSLGNGDGGLQLLGQFAPSTGDMDLRADLQQFPATALHSRLAEGSTSLLAGTAHVSGNLRQHLSFDVDITGNGAGTDAAAVQSRGPWEVRAVQGNGTWSPRELTLERIHLDGFQAAIDGSDIEVALPGMESIKARISADAPGLSLQADTTMPRQSAAGRIDLTVSSAEEVLAWLRDLPFIGDHIPVQRATGTASLEADWQGNWQDWKDGIAQPEAHPELHLNATAEAHDLRVEFAPRENAPAPPPFEMPQLSLQVQGNMAAADVLINGEVRANDNLASLDLDMQMTRSAGDAGTQQWNVSIKRLAAAATQQGQTDAWQLRLGEGVAITARTGKGIELTTTAGSATVTAPTSVAAQRAPLELSWKPVSWQRAANGDTRLVTSGSARGIQPAWLEAILATPEGGPLARAGMRTDLVLSGEWDVQMTDRLDIRAHMQRESGDMWLTAPDIGAAGPPRGVSSGDVAAGIRNFAVTLQSTGEDVGGSLNLETDRAGVITAEVRTRLDQHDGSWSLPDAAPLSGKVSAHLQDIGAWGFLTPPGWRMLGTLDADIDMAGTVQDPTLQGQIQGSALNIRSVLDGVDLHDGTLRATLNGRQLDIDELSFQGGTGSRAYVSGISGNLTRPPAARGKMTASGTIDWSGVADAGPGETGIAMDLNASLERMQLLVRHDRQLTASGDLSARLQQGKLRVRGALTVDRATILLPDVGAATLGDDVIIVRPGDTLEEVTVGRLETARPMDLEIKLDLGRDLALQGQGITTRLEGDLTIRNNGYGGHPVSIVGQVRTVQGRYRAWGQALDVETGVLSFNGPYDNPSLDLVAVRPDIEVRAGVRVTGTLRSPQARLFSEPDLPEAEKLSWVVLGRSPATSSADGISMQKAALTLLAGKVGSGLASGLGVDEVGLSEEGVSVGKRLGDELYVTYVAGLSGAASTLYILYDITRRLTVRAQTGESSAVDLIYTFSFD